MGKLTDYFTDFETNSFFLFYLLCKYRFKFYSKKQIEKYQKNRIRNVTKYAIKNSKYFQKKYGGLNIDNFSSFPTTNKKEMMDNLTDYNTVGFTKDQILNFCLEIEKTRDFTKRLDGLNIGMSSGTSGNKGVEIVTKREESYMKSALFARFDFPKGEKINLAFILRVSAPAFSLNKWGHKLSYISQLNTIEEITKQLEKINPNVLSAPPSMLKLIAKEIENKRLNIKPQRIISYAEILYDDVKEYLKRVFGCTIHEIYKCTEGPIAITCKHGNLHINEDLVYVETLNLDGTQTPIGKSCQKLVVTDLHKKAQPIIRYELNDIITISSKKCHCGSNFRVIEKIQGRSDDIFWAKNIKTKKWQFIIPDYISRAVISSSENIEEYQVIQESPEEILIRLQLKSDKTKKDFEKEVLISNINNLYQEYGCKNPKIVIKFEKPEINKNSNKLIRIHRNFNIKDTQNE
jgi:putative adenylate-forming enzyme